MAPLTPVTGDDVGRLLDAPVRRDPVGLDDGRSGATLERLTLAGGSTVVVKWVRPGGDWLMRAMHDEGRAAALWEDGILDRVPPEIDHAVLGTVPAGDGGGWALVMRDVHDWLIPAGRTLTREDSRRVIAAVHALHATFAGADLPGLAALADRYTVLGPQLPRRERGGTDAVPKLVERGWARFAERVPEDVAGPVMALLEDPAPLVAALARRPHALVHGDLKVPNLGLGPDRVVVLDWGSLTGLAPAAVDWAWYLATSANRVAASREAILADVRAAEGNGHDPIALNLALLGALLQLGWNKALDAAEHPEPPVRAREQEDLEWWVRTARGVLDAWPLS